VILVFEACLSLLVVGVSIKALSVVKIDYQTDLCVWAVAAVDAFPFLFVSRCAQKPLYLQLI
jgi:hypothetical protein